MDCAILGDQMVQALSQVRPHCEQRVVPQITTREFVHRFTQPISARHVLISLGTNDGAGLHLKQDLRVVRGRIINAQVTWLLSASNTQAAQMAAQVAREHGDRVIQITQVMAPDGRNISPAGYNRLSQMWRPL